MFRLTSGIWYCVSYFTNLDYMRGCGLTLITAFFQWHFFHHRFSEKFPDISRLFISASFGATISKKYVAHSWICIAVYTEE